MLIVDAALLGKLVPDVRMWRNTKEQGGRHQSLLRLASTVSSLRVLGRKVETKPAKGLNYPVCLSPWAQTSHNSGEAALESLGAELRLVGWNSLVCKLGTNTIMTSRLDIATTPASELADCTPLVAFFPPLIGAICIAMLISHRDGVLFRPHAGGVPPLVSHVPAPVRASN